MLDLSIQSRFVLGFTTKMSHAANSFTYTDHAYGIHHPLVIPYENSIEELAQFLMIKHDLPIYAKEALENSLKKFIEEKTNEYFQKNADELISKARNHETNVDDIIKDWEKVMREEMVEFGEKKCASDEELFAVAYHKLVHSPALETMLQLEHMYSKTVREKTEEKNASIKRLSEKQSEEMNHAVDKLEKGMTESKINDLVAKHYETHSLLQGRLTSELDTIKEAQRREYREWIMQMVEQNQANSSLPAPSSPSTPPPFKAFTSLTRDRSTDSTNATVLEESFTIHLGSQLKQMHNIRILSANVMDLCTVPDVEELSEPTPQILHTALGLYSNDLAGLVLMTDNKIGSRLTQEFQEMCQKTTEFHFPHIDDQLHNISSSVQQYFKKNLTETGRNANSELLQPGDFYMTKHSNLAQVHVIFHIVSDDSLRGSDINSRHPVVLGLRHVLKTACSNDVTSLTIPLLLQYDMTEDMTISWCEKRGELVFKCVKGFMIEMASWGGSDLKNLQFMLPQGISHAVFASLTEMLPRIFKESNPKILK